jgi:hypothetical protein
LERSDLESDEQLQLQLFDNQRRLHDRIANRSASSMEKNSKKSAAGRDTSQIKTTTTK